MILTDLHTHPTPWNQRADIYSVFVQMALNRGINILGFSEHGPPCHSHPRYRGLEEAEMADYCRAVAAVKAAYAGKIQIFCGLELDYLPHKIRIYEGLRSKYPFDYFLGSVHLIDDWHLDDPDSLSASRHRLKSPSDLYWLYYEQVIAAAESGVFHSLAHLDYLRRSLPHPPCQPPDFTQDLFAEVAEKISRTGTAVEVNSHGLRLASAQELHPTAALLRQLILAGVKFTLGSDAHEPERVGEGLQKAQNALREQALEVDI